jgi:hypothetical protein
MTRYFHVATGAIREAPEGTLHYPWVEHVGDRLERARAAARGVVAERRAAASAEAEAPSKPKRKHTRKPEASADA